MMIYNGHKIHCIDIHPFNIDIIDNTRNTSSYSCDIATLLGGPAANIIMFILLKFLFLFNRCDSINLASYQNLFLGIVNLLPVTASDGGQIFFIFLNKKLPIYTANIICQVVSCVILIPLAVLGFLILLNTRYNFTLLLVSCYIMIFMVFRDNGFY